MSLWSTVRATVPTGLQLLFCFECGYSSIVPHRDEDAHRQAAASSAPLSQAAAPPACPRCGSHFVETTTDPTAFPDFYWQRLTDGGGRPTGAPAEAALPSVWGVLRSVFDTIQNSAPVFAQDAQDTFSRVWSAQWGDSTTAPDGSDAEANGLPAECRHFTTDDVLSTFEQFPHGVPNALGTGTSAAVSATQPCPICLDECQSTTCPPCHASTTPHVVVLHCKHVFHRVCLAQWISARHFTCPVCRQPMIYR